GRGGRGWAWRSPRHGAATQPPASSTRAAAGASTSTPTAATMPSITNTSEGRVPVASTTVPPRRRTSPAKVASRAEHEKEDGHAHGDAVGHLPGDDRARKVGDLGCDLHP